MPGLDPVPVRVSRPRAAQAAADRAARRRSATCAFIAFCSFSNARTSICRTRSREMLYCCDRSSSVVGLSFSRRSIRMWRSRSFSVFSAPASSALRPVSSSRSAIAVSWLSVSSTSQSCHSPSLSCAHRRVQAVIGRGQAAVHADHVLLRHVQHAGDLGHLLGLQVAVVDRLHLALQPAQVEEQLLLRRRGAHFHQRPASAGCIPGSRRGSTTWRRSPGGSRGPDRSA